MLEHGKSVTTFQQALGDVEFDKRTESIDARETKISAPFILELLKISSRPHPLLAMTMIMSGMSRGQRRKGSNKHCR